ncbi:MAG: VanZ family protein [Acidobacteriota bacterium]|nr:VanZ family protein [Acidobacteriota bacterium]
MPALLAILVALLLYGTLSPFRFDFAHHAGNPLIHLLHSWPSGFTPGNVRDAVLNVAIFVPLGAAAFVTYARPWPRRAAFVLAVLHGSLLSLAVELLQYYDATRTSSASDWLFNTVGTLAGATLALLFRRRIEAVVSSAGRRGAAPGLLLAACWMAAQLYPLLPVITRSKLWAAWALLTASRISWVEVIAGAAGWFVFAVALRAAWEKLSWRWVALAMLVVPLRLVIADRAVGKSDLLAAAVALALWCLSSDAARPGAAWLLMIAALFVREFAPFHLGPPHAFSWIPFAASMEAEGTTNVVVILRKAYEYGAMIWLLRAGKVRYLAGAVLLAIALFAAEMLQTRMPGRTPEITDSVLALLMGLILRVVT